jgi:hypothetical protein
MSITIALVLHPPDLRNFDHLTVEEPQDEGLRMYKSHEVERSGYRVHISRRCQRQMRTFPPHLLPAVAKSRCTYWPRNRFLKLIDTNFG